MSTSSKSKSKDKAALKAGKEPSKISMKPSINHGSSPPHAPIPIIQSFNALDISSPSFSPPKSNRQFRTTDDPDNHSMSSQSTAAEYDSSSNNSCSGESEDQKEKPTLSPPQHEAILSCDNDKRDKNRLKNERKHQRQKEKRAQELHERCTAFLTSRKLESLSHQLVAMGFPADRATMAVIINKGRMEECVAWLLHERDDNRQQVSVSLEDKSCVAIDITDELVRITNMVVKFRCSRQDVERAVVTCEGDLLKAEENLLVQKQAAAARKSESVESLDSLNDEVMLNNIPALKNANKGATATQARQDGRSSTLSKSVPKPTDLSRNQVAPGYKRWSTMNVPLLSSVRASTPPDKREVLAPREPFIVMQRPKDIPAAPNRDMGNKHNAIGANGSVLQQLYPLNHTQPSSLTELPATARWSSHHVWNASGTTNSPPLTTMSPAGLFTGWGFPPSSESSSQNDWNTRGSNLNRDYTSIDWSLDLTPLRPSMKIDTMSNTWSTMFMGGKAARPPPPPALPAASFINGGGRIYFPGLREVGGRLSDPSGSGSSLEWSSPFEGRDLFRVPRKYVTSPSM